MSRPQLNDRINEIVEGSEEGVDSTEVDPEDIRIPTPKEPEVDPAVYRDVENLLFRGFLILPAEINGVTFLFKSINHHEFEYIQWVSGSMSGDLTGKSIERYYNAFLAFGVFMIDGQNILPEREKWIPIIQDHFEKMPPSARGKIIQYLSEVNRRASSAVTLTEAYNTESYSRFKWAQFRGLDVMSSASTGINGSERLGTNFAQLVWRALNYFEDLRDTAEREWDNAKFIGSCFAGKGIQKIYTQDTNRRQKEREDRTKRKDQLIRQVVLREDPEEAKNSGRYVMTVARTAEELADQLERGLRGEKDWHDEVVAREEAKLRAQIRDRQTKVQEIVKSRDQEQALPYMASSSLEGISSEEVQQRIERKRQLEHQQTAASIVYPEMADERMSAFANKYLQLEDATYTETGVKVTDRDPKDVPPQLPQRPRAVPFRR